MTYRDYDKFVDGLLSKPSSNFDDFINRLKELNNQGCNIEKLLTGAVGMSAEAGEFLEITKKIIFQGKPWDEDNKFHLKRELSDQIFYLLTACLALGISVEEVIDTNIEKLNARYPGGFEAYRSENRKEGDI